MVQVRQLKDWLCDPGNHRPECHSCFQADAGRTGVDDQSPLHISRESTRIDASPLAASSRQVYTLRGKEMKENRSRF